MNILADEGVERCIVSRLRDAGHSVLYVAEMAPGITDAQVLAEGNAYGCLLVTNDKDFGELVFRRQIAGGGVVLLRLHGLSDASKAETVCSAIDIAADKLRAAFSVVAPGAVRIRPRGPS